MARVAASEVVVALLTDLYHLFLQPSTLFATASVAGASVSKTDLVSILENRVIRANGVSCVCSRAASVGALAPPWSCCVGCCEALRVRGAPVAVLLTALLPCRRFGGHSNALSVLRADCGGVEGSRVVSQFRGCVLYLVRRGRAVCRLAPATFWARRSSRSWLQRPCRRGCVTPRRYHQPPSLSFKLQSHRQRRC
jgi:hypothetical protein